MRQPIIIGNWKMNLSRQESKTLCSEIAKHNPSPTIEIGVCPPSIHIHTVQSTLSESAINWGAQNCYSESHGAYTGEISVNMLTDYGCKYVILGHSERRTLFKETNQDINAKLRLCLDHDLVPILCVGESLKERENNEEKIVILTQLRECLHSISADSFMLRQCIIAYEPIWAIGTGQVATPKQAQDMHHYIRTQLAALLSQNHAQRTQIIYGGSVSPDNSKDLLSQPDIDGALIGGASLKASSFNQIIHTCESMLAVTQS